MHIPSSHDRGSFMFIPTVSYFGLDAEVDRDWQFAAARVQASIWMYP